MPSSSQHSKLAQSRQSSANLRAVALSAISFLVGLQFKNLVDLFALSSGNDATINTNAGWAPDYHLCRTVKSRRAGAGAEGGKTRARNEGIEVPAVHMIAIADANFARKYAPIFKKNEQYARRHGYEWHVIGTDSPICTKMYAHDFFFRKHCMVAEWMEDTLDEDDVVVVFDSDVVPYRPGISLESWTSTGEDIVMYERIWNTEIAAGNYIARNNYRARTFLREWAQYVYEMPKEAFSSSDNGAIHLHIRRVAGLEGRKTGRCGQLYRNLTALSDNLDPYYEFVGCARQNVTPGTIEALDGSGLTLRLMGKSKAWVVDGVYERIKRDEPGPVFHHGVKPNDGDVPFDRGKVEKYGLQLQSEKSALKTNSIDVKVFGQKDVSCGGHYAPNCTMCAIDQDGKRLGRSSCNGDCIWRGRPFSGRCILLGTETENNPESNDEELDAATKVINIKQTMCSRLTEVCSGIWNASQDNPGSN